MAGVLITLTGTVKIEDQGVAPRHLASAQAQVAFARLTLERASGTGRDQLADTVWPDGLPDTWASALRSVVSRVRAFVASGDTPRDAPVVAQGGRYLLRLPENASVDLERAEESVHEAARAFAAGAHAEAQQAAAAGIACLRSPFLPEHEGEWVNAVRERVRGLLVSGLETASMAAAAAGDARAALGYADEAVAEAPLRESAHRCRMTAHTAAGNRAEALHAYHRLRRVLAEELGVEPAPETQALYLDLLGSPVTDRAADPARPAAPPPFIGRAAELEVIAGAWAAARRGEGRMVLVTGPPGIGKTRLATAAAHRAGLDGATVLYGRCDPGTVQPFQPFVDALGALVAAAPEDAPPEFGAGLRDTLDAALPGADTTPAERAHLLTALSGALLGVARSHPVLLVLDGLDGADPDSLVLLRRLLRQRQGAALLVLATAGSCPSRGDRIVPAVNDADNDGALDRVALGGLTEADVPGLLRGIADDPAGVPLPHQLLTETDGNPYLMLQLVRWRRDHPAATGLPAAILEYTNARLAALDDGPRRLLRAAAAAGTSFELDLVLDAAELDARQALDALDTLVAARLVAEVVPPEGQPRAPHVYRLTQDVMRRAIYERFSQARRALLHTRIADAIEARRRDPARYSDVLAHHRAAGAPDTGDPRAVRWGWHAATRAARLGAAQTAVRLHRQALEHVPAGDHELRAEALINLGLAELAAGVLDCDRTLFDGAVRAWHLGRTGAAARAVLGLADVVLERPRLRSEAVALLDSLVGVAISPGRQDGLGVGMLGRLMARQVRLGARLPGGPVVRTVLAALTAELARMQGPDSAAPRRGLAADLLDLATAAGDRTAALVAAHHAATVAELTGDTTARAAALSVLAGPAGPGDSVAGEVLLVESAVAAAVTEGRFVDAVAATRLVRDQIVVLDGVDPPPGSVAARQMLVARWLRSGSWPAPGGPLTGDLEIIEESLTALVGGDRGMPHLTIRAMATGAVPLPRGDDWLHVVGLLALGAAELGDPATAEALLKRLAPYAGMSCGIGYRSYVGPATLHLGRLSGVAGDFSAAERHLTAALSELADRGARPWLALAQSSLAQVLEDRGRPGDGRYAAALRREAEQTLIAAGLRRGGD